MQVICNLSPAYLFSCFYFFVNVEFEQGKRATANFQVRAKINLNCLRYTYACKHNGQKILLNCLFCKFRCKFIKAIPKPLALECSLINECGLFNRSIVLLFWHIFTDDGLRFIQFEKIIILLHLYVAAQVRRL